jgi:hypothetical protein
LSSGAHVRAGGFIGPALIAGACMAWAIDNNLTRKVSTNDAMVIACTKGLVAGPITHHKHTHQFEWNGQEPHSHPHIHEPLDHEHPHFPDAHHHHQH